MYIKRNIEVVNTDNVFNFYVVESIGGGESTHKEGVLRFIGAGTQLDVSWTYPTLEKAHEAYDAIWKGLLSSYPTLNLNT